MYLLKRNLNKQRSNPYHSVCCLKSSELENSFSLLSRWKHRIWNHSIHIWLLVCFFSLSRLVYTSNATTYVQWFQNSRQIPPVWNAFMGPWYKKFIEAKWYAVINRNENQVFFWRVGFTNAGFTNGFLKCSVAHNRATEHACTELQQWRDFKSRISKHLLSALCSDSWLQHPVLYLPPHILMGCGNAKRNSTYHMSCGNSPVPEWYGNYLYFCDRHVWGGVSRAYSLQAPGQN